MADFRLRQEDNSPEPVTHDLHGARSVACPFCHAIAGEPCHSTGHSSDVHVHRDHQARFDAFHEGQGWGR
jgi:hypothetical protein